MSTAYNRQVLRAASANAVSEVIDTCGLDVLYLQVSTTVTAATLATTTLTVGGGVTSAATPPIDGTGVVATSPAVAGIALSNGVITYTNPAIATHQTVLKIVQPPPYVVLTYAFGAGGGTVDVLVRAAGWQH